MGMFFKCFPRMGPEIGQFQTIHQNVPEHFCLILPNFGAHAWLPAACRPLFTTNLSYLTTNWPDLCHFCMNSLHFNAEYHCNKNGANGAVVGQVPHFGPFPFKKNQRKGCQKGWKTKFHQIRFSACQTILDHKRSTPVVFWGEKRPWVEWWLNT